MIVKLVLLKELPNHKGHKMGQYMCPGCDQPFATRHSSVNSGRTTGCNSCAKQKTKVANAKLLEERGGPVSKSNLYWRWSDMNNRCYNKNNHSYGRYGAKGVTVCDDWRYNFKAFEDWALNNGYKKELVIDKDVLCDKLGITPKIYSPDTCQWISKLENDSYRKELNG